MQPSIEEVLQAVAFVLNEQAGRHTAEAAMVERLRTHHLERVKQVAAEYMEAHCQCPHGSVTYACPQC